jgi:predicted ferric reductase
MIIPNVFASWHFHTATKPYANSDIWGRWFQVLMLLGIAAWVYRVVWRDGVRRGVKYVVKANTQEGSFVTVEMQAVKKKLHFATGQFLFVRFDSRQIAEPHPFTIASHPDEKTLRLHIRDLGDWSQKLGTAHSVGTQARLEGPYGSLSLFSADESTTIWFAGGIGITPFLSAIRSKNLMAPVPHLFYSVRSGDDVPDLSVLLESHQQGRIHLHLFVSQENGRLSRPDVLSVLDDLDTLNAHVVMCGPDSFVRDMTSTVRTAGVKHVHVEGFDIHSGIGPDVSCEVEKYTPILWRSVKSRIGNSKKVNVYD